MGRLKRVFSKHSQSFKQSLPSALLKIFGLDEDNWLFWQYVLPKQARHAAFAISLG
jgi:hypothetical protein